MGGSTKGLNTGQDGMEIRIPPLMNIVNITLKKKVTTLENVIEK